MHASGCARIAGRGVTKRGATAARNFAAVLALCAALAGCQGELYSNLSESEANQMLAVLMSSGVSTTKTAKGKDGFSLSVDERDMLRAIAILKDAGFPKNTRDSIGKVFQKSGIMSSPFEERVRYIYALSEDVAQTLSNIDGVLAARVHIVLPDAPQLGQPVKPSSAAVFIKHQSGVDLDFFVPQIRRLVSSSIEGLEYAAVTVVLTEALPTKSVTTADASGTLEVLPGLAVRDTDVGRFWQLLGGVVAFTLMLAGSVAFAWRTVQQRRAKRPAAATANAALVEPS
jgi:type III secretion protein J